MSAILAPIANMFLPSSDSPTATALSNAPGATETTAASTLASSNTAAPVPTVSDGKVLGASAEETTGARESSSNIDTPAVPPVPNIAALSAPARVTRSQEIPMQTISTQTDLPNNIESQRAIPITTTVNTSATGLYGTLPGKGVPPLPVVGKTKHSAAAHYLRTANARDLPSYPSPGLAHPEAAGAAAALLAHTSHKPVEIWRPDPASAAGAAASLAHANPRRVEIWKATPGEPGGKAALNALEEPSSPQPYKMSEASKRWSLNGAIGAMQGSKRRSGSSPMPLTVQQEHEAASAGHSALTAATIAHMPSGSIATAYPTSEGLAEAKLVDAGGVPQQDKRKSDILRAATISMSKSNRDTLPPDAYGPRTLVQPQLDLRLPAATPPSRRHNNSNIEEAARKVAAERLAKLGYNTDIPRSPSLLGTQGAQASLRRSYSVNSPGPSDRGRARTTNADMALMQDNLARIEAKKRGENAALLMSTAQRNVQARMSGIDKQVAESRGFVRREDWDAKAIEIAQAGSDNRMKHHGKVSIGGGAYMSADEIDAIAERNVQPVLEEMNRNTEAERTRIEAEKARALEVQLEAEESRRAHGLQRKREKETREDIKRAKAAEKEEEKRRKEEEKRVIKERKQLAKIDSKRGRESMGTSDARGPLSPASPRSDGAASEGGIRGLINRFRRRHSRQISHDEKNAIANSAHIEGSPVVPTFSGGHRAAMAEQQQQQQLAAEKNGDAPIRNGNASPRPFVSRIPRPVSALLASTNGNGTQGSIRVVSNGGPPPVVNGKNGTEVKRRHSLSSVGATAHHFGLRKRGDAALSPRAEDQGTKNGKGKVNGRDFSKTNGRIASTEDNLEYPDEARDTFSQQPNALNRPTSGYFPQDERRFSGGEGSVSSRFRENL